VDAWLDLTAMSQKSQQQTSVATPLEKKTCMECGTETASFYITCCLCQFRHCCGVCFIQPGVDEGDKHHAAHGMICNVCITQ